MGHDLCIYKILDAALITIINMVNFKLSKLKQIVISPLTNNKMLYKPLIEQRLIIKLQLMFIDLQYNA